MCELLGLAFNRPVSPGLSFRGFRHRGRRNRDGWGLAAITATKPTIVKEPINAEESDTATALPDRDPLHAPLFIGHVRAASRGRVSQANTHPFSRVFAGGTFTFAHNGTLDVARLKKMAGPDFTPEGQTDSELAMGAVLTWLGSGQAAGGALLPREPPRRGLGGRPRRGEGAGAAGLPDRLPAAHRRRGLDHLPPGSAARHRAWLRGIRRVSAMKPLRLAALPA
jgi:hypothetical protein